MGKKTWLGDKWGLDLKRVAGGFDATLWNAFRAGV